MEEIKCILCNTDSSKIVIQENGYCGKQCSCSLIFISPRPRIEEIIDIYGHGQANISAESHIGGSFLKRLYAKHTLRILKKFIKKGNLLEIGSGGGYFLDEARKAGFEPHGIELNPVQANYITNNLKIACDQKPLSSNSFDNKMFDVIYHSDVISHFHDPIAEFRTMYKKLNPNGLIIFETGNIGDIDSKYYKLFTRFQYPDHLFFFGEQNLEQLLALTGFTITKISRYSIILQLFWLRFLHTIRKSTSSNNIQSPNSKIEKKYSFKKIIKNIYYLFLYCLRYIVGWILPKYKRPQTLIVVAHKII
ncbi:class I SAM-dependent methyltransferase [Candidatus Dependentiae bacterium]|nr:class I SAM-dependent methyltransferase [Candidatus Dependentiae bacterium]